ncbi:importin subunit beta-3 [Marasmius crinis-equi]|uniref:Importin subunit beta-3 n=1 Tax=Marasmius crinis-equi TaxID=585013 RepID=A0ABR3FP77_9AGAR
MEPVVPQEITNELTQILSNLVLGDNDIRASAEKAVNDRLNSTPDLYVLALAQFAIGADKEVMRSFSLVLLRRLLFRPSASQPSNPGNPSNSNFHMLALTPTLTLYDRLSSSALTTLERLLLHSLGHESSSSVRRKTVDTISDVANQGMLRGRPWHALQAQVFSMTNAGLEGSPSTFAGAQAVGLRESAFRVFAGCPNLVMDLQTDAVLSVFSRGLKDEESIEVRHAALEASVIYLTSADPNQLAQSLGLMYPLLDTLPPLLAELQALQPGSSAGGATSPIPNFAPAADSSGTSNKPLSTNTGKSPAAHLISFISSLTPLASAQPMLFYPHLSPLLSFLPALVLPPVDPGPTPTVKMPFPGANAKPKPSDSWGEEDSGEGGEEDEHEERAKLRLTALEFMISLCEARPSMFRRSNSINSPQSPDDSTSLTSWVGVVVRACLEGMSEIDEDSPYGVEGGLERWLADDPSSSTTATTENESAPALYEQSLDRMAYAMGGRSVLPPAFQYIPSMIASYDWRARHAGLMAIAAIAEGTGKVMVNELGKVVELVLPLFRDTHPRVRYAACQGQLCTDLEEIIQEQYHEQLFSALIPTLEDPIPRVHAHAAAALINFCEGVARDTLLPYLDPIVERLLRLLGVGVGAAEGTAGAGGGVKRYVQEQAITTLAMVADASEGGFVKHYSAIMPMLLNVLRNADGPDYKKMRVKAMECAGLIAIAVGRDTFRPDANTLVESLIRIQKSPPDPQDTQLSHYLMGTWAKICQAMGEEFEVYLPVVMPQLLATASAKADVSLEFDDDSPNSEREGWETVNMDGQTVNIRTAAIEEKCQAFETMVIYASTLGARFAPYLAQSLEVTLPSMKFYFHDGVREACAMLLPMLLASGHQSGTLTNQMVSATFHQIITVIQEEHDTSFLASLFKSFTDCTKVLGGPTILLPEFREGIIEATKRQLHAIAEKRRARGRNPGELDAEEREDLALLEEMEDFALEDMGRCLGMFDDAKELLVAISSVKELGVSKYESSDEES